jgi:hypothetical protein
VKRLPYLLVTLALPAAASAAACSANKNEPAAPAADAPDAAVPDAEPPYPVVTIAAEPQRAGDPAKGYRALVNEAYVPCGIPYSAFSRVYSTVAPDDQLPGREGKNTTLAYNYTAMTTKDGVDIVTSNCLTCHAAHLDGKLVVGLGATSSLNSKNQPDGDFTTDAASHSQHARPEPGGRLHRGPLRAP